jgi:hypothetical protein
MHALFCFCEECRRGGKGRAMQVREHIQRTQCSQISWTDLLTICAGISPDHVQQMVKEYEEFGIWLVEHDANGHVRIHVENMG